MIPYGRQSIDASDIAAVTAVLNGDWLTCGPAVTQFEQELRRISGAAHAIALSNGTSALRLLYQVAGIGPGVRVGVPALTFVATASQAQLLGAEVVLLDVDPHTLLLTPEILEACTEHLDWVVPVHVAGRLCDMAGIAKVAARKGIRVLEDAAHAFGSTWDNGDRCGDCRYSEGAIFSFHPVKNITCGEGGAICVRNPAWDARCRSLRHHGIIRENFLGSLATQEGSAPWYHEFHAPSGNDRLSDLHCALGASQCARLEPFKAARNAIVERYRQELSDLPFLHVAPPAPAQQPFWHLCVAQLDWQALGRTRQAFVETAKQHGIAFQVHYIPLHRQPILAQAVQFPLGLPRAEQAYPRLLSLPCFPALQPTEQDHVIHFLRSQLSAVRE